MNPVQQKSVRTVLFSQKNRNTLYGLLASNFQSRIGQLDGVQADRLERTLDHYVEEVYSVHGEQPLSTLNREILQIAAQDFGKYIQRKEVVRTSETTPIKTVMNDAMFRDTTQRLEIMQQERTEIKALPPPIPDFHASMEDDGTSSMELFEKIKKMRERDYQFQPAAAPSSGIMQIVQSDDMFRENQIKQNRLTEMVMAERVSKPSVPIMDKPLAVPPDGRDLFMKNLIIESEALPELDRRTNLQQDVLIRQDDTVNYKEIENNLFINSNDRNWLYTSNGENRYMFTINFDPANNRQGFGTSPAVQQRFRNIVRVELIKAILPLEALDVSIMMNGDLSGVVVPPASNMLANTSYQSNVLGLPYISAVVQELDSNNFGTNNFIDRSFGVLQYDANWSAGEPSNLLPHRGSSSSTDQTIGQTGRGFACLIPKFLKCQKVYSPTPLSTLQKMTISLLRPNGDSLSGTLDVLDIRNIFAGNTFATSTTTAYNGADVSLNPYFYYINTVPFFSRFSVSVGDRIQIAGYTYSDTTYETNPTLRVFTDWVNRPTGHVVINTGFNNGTVGTYDSDGSNAVGYANYIIIQAPYMDPTTGSTNLVPFANITTLLQNPDIFETLKSPRRLINLNRQTHLCFRIITRQMDSVAQIRPDNM